MKLSQLSEALDLPDVSEDVPEEDYFGITDEELYDALIDCEDKIEDEIESVLNERFGAKDWGEDVDPYAELLDAVKTKGWVSRMGHRFGRLKLGDPLANVIERWLEKRLKRGYHKDISLFWSH